MTNKIFNRILLLLVVSIATSAFAQDVPVKNWDIEKIKGVRQLPYPSYTGFPFLTDTWVLGEIELEDGVKIDSLYLRYSSFKDELVYYNKEAAAQIVIDKKSLKGFIYTGTDGFRRVFRKLPYYNSGNGDRFFEVLSDGETDLLAYRKISLIISSPYKNESGALKNMIYSPDYSYYFYSPEKGFVWVRINQASLLSKFDKVSQKNIKKLLRKNKIRIADENSFVYAWNLIEKEGYKVAF